MAAASGAVRRGACQYARCSCCAGVDADRGARRGARDARAARRSDGAAAPNHGAGPGE